jgi:hypothetical protein
MDVSHDRETYRHPADVFRSGEGTGPNEAAMDDAAEALRAAEIEAVGPDVSTLTADTLAAMDIDELRAVAKALNVPDRETITDQDELLAAVRQCL